MDKKLNDPSKGNNLCILQSGALLLPFLVQKEEVSSKP